MNNYKDKTRNNKYDKENMTAQLQYQSKITKWYGNAIDLVISLRPNTKT